MFNAKFIRTLIKFYSNIILIFMFRYIHEYCNNKGKFVNNICLVLKVK